MNKFLGFGIAIVLCMAAAGFGAYMALRQQPAAVPATVNQGTGVPVARAPAAAETGNPAGASVAGAAPSASAGVMPAPAPGEAPKTPQVEKPSRPPVAARPAASTDPGGMPAALPASQSIPAVDRPAAGGNVNAGAPADAVPAPPTLQEPVPLQPPPPPQKVLEELVVSADSVIGLRIESTISSEVARVEDPVEARVTRDVRVGSEIAIPSGSRVLGSVIQVERGGKVKTAARIGVRFHTLVLPDNTRMRIQTEAIYREGQSPGQESATKIGAATMGGAILGAIIGGGKGAAIGGAVGAAGGTGAVMAGGRNPAVLASGTALTVRLSQPVTIVVEKEELRN